MNSQINEDKGVFIAHIDGEGKDIQTVKDHCLNVATLAEQFAPDDLKQTAYQCGLYHDVGKYSKEFQAYIRGKRSSKVDHSTAGAKLLFKRGSWASIMESICISGHHTGLLNFGNITDPKGERTFLSRLKKKIPDYSSYQKELGDVSPITGVESLSEPIGNALMIRMLFSSLVDADFLDTENFMNRGKKKRGTFSSIHDLYMLFFHRMKEKGYFDPQNRINQKRCEILKKSIVKAQDPPGLFTLTVPTGGGKTLSAFAFALKQAEQHEKKRIIYVIPYTSIIEQTVDVLQSFLGTHNVIAHDSQINYDDQSEEMEEKRLATENWDAPVIVTTNVQFIESLFGNRTSKCRKLHNIANSIIIMDEAQMLPISYLKPVVQTIEDLVKDFHCSVVLCSATQPRLERFFNIKAEEIIDHIPELYHFFQRTKYQLEGEKTYEDIAHSIDAKEEILCVCATKKEANCIYEKVEKNCFYLSTNLCPVHREKVIDELKKRLDEDVPCRVVSTSIISVGVDIDFPEVYLENSGVDSLIQGAGRCNREGKRKPEESLVHVFTTENLERSSFMKQERDCTKIVVQNHTEAIDSPQIVSQYFNKLYEAKSAILDKDNIINLSTILALEKISQKVKIIEDQTKNVFIPYDKEAKVIEQKLRMGIRTRELMRKAAKYMVAVWSSSNPPGLYEQMKEDGVIDSLDDEIAVLIDLSVYDKNLGLHYKNVEGRGIQV